METSFREVKSLLPEDEAAWLEEQADQAITHDDKDSPHAPVSGTQYTVIADPVTFEPDELDGVVQEDRFRALRESLAPTAAEQEREGRDDSYFLRGEDVDLIQWAMYKVPVFRTYDRAERTAVAATERWPHRYVPGPMDNGDPRGIHINGNPAATIAISMDEEYRDWVNDYN